MAWHGKSDSRGYHGGLRGHQAIAAGADAIGERSHPATIGPCAAARCTPAKFCCACGVPRRPAARPTPISKLIRCSHLFWGALTRPSASCASQRGIACVFQSPRRWHGHCTARRDHARQALPGAFGPAIEGVRQLPFPGRTPCCRLARARRTRASCFLGPALPLIPTRLWECPWPT